VPILADRGLYNSFSSRCLWQRRRLRLRFRAQLLPGAQRQQPGPPSGTGQASSGTAAGASA
jgi:hypothetical protein